MAWEDLGFFVDFCILFQNQFWIQTKAQLGKLRSLPLRAVNDKWFEVTLFQSSL